MNLKLDKSGDLLFERGNIALVTGAAEIAQKLKVRYRFFLGEWYLDTRLGVPWIQTIFATGTPDELVRSKLMEVAVKCPGVASVEEFTYTRDRTRRQLVVTFQARSMTGERIRFDEEFIL
jgi:hypothetical protein